MRNKILNTINNSKLDFLDQECKELLIDITINNLKWTDFSDEKIILDLFEFNT